MKTENCGMTQEEIDNYKKPSDDFFHLDEDSIVKSMMLTQYKYASNEEERVEILQQLESSEDR